MRPLFLASVDLTKAFDRVSTDAILRGASRAGLSGGFLEYLRSLYGEASTVLGYGGGSLVVRPTTGVRQGDPLSLILFNLVIDEWLCGLDPGVAFVSGDLRVDAMAFADDLIVMASTAQGLQYVLDGIVSFFEPRGLEINAAKSFTLSLQPSGRDKKLKVNTATVFRVKGQPLPVTDTASVWRYLGISFGAVGRVPMPLERELAQLLGNVARAPLKPQQRLVVLRFYLKPRLYHRLVLGSWTAGLLTKLDRQVRASVRRWLALPHDTPMGYFHADVKSGGLGVPCLRTAVPGLQLARFGRLQTSDQPTCAQVARCRLIKEAIRHAEHLSTYKGTELRTRDACFKFWAGELHRSADGAALSECKKVPYAQS